VSLNDLLQQHEELVEQIEAGLQKKKREIQRKKTEIEEIEMFSHYDSELVDAFFKKPYEILPRGNEEWYLIVPKFFDLNVGYLTKSSDSYNVFIVNKYADYLGAVPSDFKQVFKFKPKIPLKMFDGMLLTGDEHQDTAWERYKGFLVRREGTDKIRVKAGKQFQLIANLISDGILPFIPKPVEKSHLVASDWKAEIDEIDRRRNMSFFKEAFKKFLQTGAVGIYWAMGVGKTIFGLEALSRVVVEGRQNLIVSGASAALREQWKNQLKLIEPAAKVVVQTYQSWHKVKGKKWGLVIFDEAHHLPAETFSKLSTIDAEYRIGLSATPYREDKRTDFIFALTGFPVGLDWRVLIELGLIREPEITLFLCATYRQKRQKLAELLGDPQKTLIYCFSLDIGRSLAKEFEVPFVHGSTPVKDRLQIIKSSQTTIISSAGKEGLSIQDIERTISYNFLFGSRQEETQFFGRLLHGESEGRHIIMMTDDEYEKYGKRIYGIQEKGFKIRVSRVGGGSSTIRTPSRTPVKRSPRRVSSPASPPPSIVKEQNVLDTSEFPLLDERDSLSENMILFVLSSNFAKKNSGLLLGDIRAVLDHNHIKYGDYQKLRSLVRGMYDKRDLSGRREGTRRRYFISKEVKT
jgi:DNA excision repair protein ERCC-3